jgi:hypothetical protein
VERSAVLSECGTYRFQLVRALERTPHYVTTEPRGTLAWVLCNPSTADAETDDATVRKCWRYTVGWGYGSMMFVNVNPYRSTNPKTQVEPAEPILVANDSWLRYAVTQCPYVIAAWGDSAIPTLVRRAVAVIHPLGPLHALHATKGGQPGHPLYLPGDAKPQLWKPTGLN